MASIDLESVAASRRFCRGCGYDLRASVDRCPDCGRVFDAANRRTFLTRPRQLRHRVFRIAVYLLLFVGLVATAGFIWLWHGWSDEQRIISDLHDRDNRYPVVLKSAPVHPLLKQYLPTSLALYADRVTEIDDDREWTDGEMELIAHFSCLKKLAVQGDRVTDRGLAAIKSLTQLQDLSITASQVTDVELTCLRGMTELKDLSIQGSKMTNAGLEQLEPLPNLRNLTICGNQVNRAGLYPWLARHPGVKIIDGPGAPLRYPPGKDD